MTVRRFDEIQRRLSEGRGLREIARALGCSRDIVREVRDGLRVSPDAPKTLPDPLWMLQIDWPPLIPDLGLGHPLKFLWEERAQHLTTYSNFWKPFYRKFPQYRQASVTAREFAAGERVEVSTLITFFEVNGCWHQLRYPKAEALSKISPALLARSSPLD
jgi:hypothetical protein